MTTCAWCEIHVSPDDPHLGPDHGSKSPAFCSADHRERWVSIQKVEECMLRQVGAAQTETLIGLLAELPEWWEERLLTLFPDVMKPVASAPVWFQPEPGGVR